MELMKGAEPFIILKSKNVGIMLIHGLTSTPQSVKGLAQRLVKQGFSVDAPLLVGHGTMPEDLIHRRADELVKGVELAFRIFQKKVKKVFVAGVSFGGNLALDLATRHKVAGVISMGAPIRMKKEYLLPLILLHRIFNPYLRKRLPKNVQGDKVIRDRVTYHEIPLPAMFRCFRWINKAKKKLKLVKSPVLVMHANFDFLVNEKSAKYIYDKVGTKDKKLLYVENTYHGIALGPSQKRVCDEIVQFVKAHS